MHARRPARRALPRCWPAASSRSTPGTVPRQSSRTSAVDEVDAARRRRGCRALMERAERLLEEIAAGHGDAARPRRGRHARGRRQAAAPAARLHLRRRAGRAASARCAPRPPSSWSTWRRSCTTTSSTARRCAAAAPTVFATRGRETATATGDFLFSRAFALLAANGDARAGAGARRTRASRWRAASWRSATMPTGVDVDEERYLLRCELKTASLFSAACRLGALAAGRPAAEVAALEALRHAGSASPSRCSTTCST